MNEEIKKLSEKFEGALKDLREEVDKKSSDPLNQEKISKLNESLDEMDKKFQQIQKEKDIKEKESLELKEKVDLLESKLVSAKGRTNYESEETKKHKIAFDNYLKRGYASVDKEIEKKYLRTDRNEDGGFLCPTDWTNELIKDLVEVSPMRSIARISRTSKRSITLNKRTGTPTAYWTGEGEEKTESKSQYGLVEIPVNKLTGKTIITSELLTDTDYNLQEEIRMDMLEQFARAEGIGFLTGDKIKKPEGILINSDIEKYNTGIADAISADSLFEIQGQFKSGYLKSRLRWILNQKTLYQDIRTLKAGDGHYLLSADISKGLPPTIAGVPYVIMPDMPDVGAGTYPMAIGDFFIGYRIVDHTLMSMIVDIYSLSDYNKVKYVMHRRLGGEVVQSESIKILKVSA